MLRNMSLLSVCVTSLENSVFTICACLLSPVTDEAQYYRRPTLRPSIHTRTTWATSLAQLKLPCCRSPKYFQAAVTTLVEFLNE